MIFLSDQMVLSQADDLGTSAAYALIVDQEGHNQSIQFWPLL